MPVVLFVHSGGFWKRDCFELARRRGYYSVCAEASGADPTLLHGFVDHVFTISLYDPEKFLSEVRAGLAAHGVDRLDGVVTYFELAVGQTARIAEDYGVRSISVDAAERARNKYEMRVAIDDPFFRGGFARVSTEAELRTFFDAHGGAPVVLKPCDLAASTGVIRILSADQVAPAWEEAQDALRKFVGLYGYETKNGLMAELMMPMGSREYNVDLFVHDGRPYVIGVAEKQGLYDGPSFREDAYVFPPVSLSAEEQRALEDEARRATRAIGITAGAVHLEAKMIPTLAGGLRPCVIELGARCAGDLEMPALALHRAGLVDLRALVLDQAVGRLSSSDLDASRMCDEGDAPSIPMAICVKYAPQAGRLLADVTIAADVAERFRVVASRFEATKGHIVLLPENDYLGAVICRGDTPAQALDNVNRAIAAIDVSIGAPSEVPHRPAHRIERPHRVAEGLA